MSLKLCPSNSNFLKYLFGFVPTAKLFIFSPIAKFLFRISIFSLHLVYLKLICIHIFVAVQQGRGPTAPKLKMLSNSARNYLKTHFPYSKSLKSNYIQIDGC